MSHPYKLLPKKAFWKSLITKKISIHDDVWKSKFNISKEDPIASFGSCFSQHISAALLHNKLNWLLTEPEPTGLSPANCLRFNYRLNSCRTGSIYTVSLLRQWVNWAVKKQPLPTEFWEKNQRIYDPFRPNIEPGGFESKEEMMLLREQTINFFHAAILKAEYFIFTLGVIDSWSNKETGLEYPQCPGVIVGEFSEYMHVFKKQNFHEVYKALDEAISEMRKANSSLKFIFLLPPVPLVATNSQDHVIVADMESKAILRTAAGQLASELDYVDYFPIYDIVASFPEKAFLFKPNQRSFHREGLDFLMEFFFNGVGFKKEAISSKEESDICEELALEHYSEG